MEDSKIRIALQFVAVLCSNLCQLARGDPPGDIRLAAIEVPQFFFVIRERKVPDFRERDMVMVLISRILPEHDATVTSPLLQCESAVPNQVCCLPGSLLLDGFAIHRRKGRMSQRS